MGARTAPEPSTQTLARARQSVGKMQLSLISSALERICEDAGQPKPYEDFTGFPPVLAVQIARLA
jgi:hypothetical protein